MRFLKINPETLATKGLLFIFPDCSKNGSGSKIVQKPEISVIAVLRFSTGALF